MEDKTVFYGPFSWDAVKEEINLKRHGISFSDPSLAFIDPRRIITHDENHSDAEERFYCIGRVNLRIVTVRFTYRGHFVRIIGAGCWRKERKFYEKTNEG